MKWHFLPNLSFVGVVFRLPIDFVAYLGYFPLLFIVFFYKINRMSKSTLLGEKVCKMTLLILISSVPGIDIEVKNGIDFQQDRCNCILKPIERIP